MLIAQRISDETDERLERPTYSDLRENPYALYFVPYDGRLCPANESLLFCLKVRSYRDRPSSSFLPVAFSSSVDGVAYIHSTKG